MNFGSWILSHIYAAVNKVSSWFHVPTVTAYKPGGGGMEGGIFDMRGHVIGNFIEDYNPLDPRSFVTVAGNRGIPYGAKFTVYNQKSGPIRVMNLDTGANEYFGKHLPLHLDFASRGNPNKVHSFLNAAKTFLTPGWCL